MTTSHTCETSPRHHSGVAEAIERLGAALVSGVPCSPVRDLIGAVDIAQAYAVQRGLTERACAAGRRVVGHKIGLTAPSVQAQIGVDQPDFGVLFEDMGHATGEQIDMDGLIQPKIEAEIAFVLGRDITEAHPTAESVRSAVDYAVAALEIVDSRVAGWDITIVDTVADNASSGRYVLGDHPLSLEHFEPAEVTMSMHIEGVEVSSGRGDACLGDPLNALAWLAGTCVNLGEPLLSGEIILSGALGPMAPVRAGAHVRAQLSELGTVDITFSGSTS
jgi:2-keto-4-pentenoate hydratase